MILIVLIGIIESTAWWKVASGLLGLGAGFGGSGDGIGSSSNGSGGLLARILIVLVWLFFASPYVCLSAACLNLIERKRLRSFYIYSLGMLGLMTLALMGMLLAEMLVRHFETAQAAMVLGNILIIVLWTYPGIKSKG